VSRPHNLNGGRKPGPEGRADRRLTINLTGPDYDRAVAAANSAPLGPFVVSLLRQALPENPPDALPHNAPACYPA
jgi:hypothetical protein